MAIKKISEFVSGTPASDSKILFEQNEKGKSCSIEEAVNTCSLSYEEIMATTDLSGKVASASALKTVFDTYKIKTVEISSANPTPLELNNCTDLYTCYKWDYAGSAYITCGGVAISSTAGAVINFPNLGGLTQVFVFYQSGSIKVRCLSFGAWSRWYKISTSESSL